MVRSAMGTPGRTIAVSHSEANATPRQSAQRAGLLSPWHGCVAEGMLRRAEHEDGAMAFSLIDKDAGAVPLTALTKTQLPRWREGAPARERDWAQAAGFTGEAGKVALVPDESGKLGRVLVGASE